MVVQLGLDRLFFRRLWKLLKLSYPSWGSSSVWVTVFVLAVAVIDQVIAYFVGIIPSEFYVVLGHRDVVGFRYLAAKAAVICVAKAMAMASLNYANYMLYLYWRQILGYRFHRLYFKDLTFYKLNMLSDKIDNPDQRLTQDIEKTTRVLATEILSKLILAPFVIGYYTYKTYMSSGWLGPVSIYIYFVLGTIINKFLLTPIVNLVYQQEQKEGNFRFKHVVVRSNSEAIGFYKSNKLENFMTNAKLDDLIHTQERLVLWQVPLTFVMRFIDYFGGVLSYFIIAIPIFMLHHYEDVDPVDLTGIVSRNSFFYMYLISNFTIIIDLSNKFGDLAGTTHRVIGLYEELERHDSDHPKTEPSSVNSLSKRTDDDETEHLGRKSPAFEGLENGLLTSPDRYGSFQDTPPDVAFTLKNVSYSMPDEHNTPLVSNLTLELIRGRNVLITGNSSSGKSSMLRVLAGLWPIDSGFIECHWSFPSSSRIMFLPQKSYFPNSGCTLRQQIVYPNLVKVNTEENDRFTEILKAVHMESVINRCEGLDTPVDFDWNEILSPGELQRLSLARVFYHKPQIAFLDEATSALGFELEQEIYGALTRYGMNFVSVGHRLSLKRFHEFELKLDGKGGWSYGEIDPSLFSSQQSLYSMN